MDSIKQADNLICTCGHTKKFHILNSTECFHCDVYSNIYKRICTKFKMDNLKYLEMLYEEKNTVR
jgi:hypothetical protein